MHEDVLQRALQAAQLDQPRAGGLGRGDHRAGFDVAVEAAAPQALAGVLDLRVAEGRQRRGGVGVGGQRQLDALVARQQPAQRAA